jgi:non-specific serine/threonine protein kinase
VTLAPIDTAAGIVPAVASAVRFSFSADQPPHQQLIGHLRPKRLLLVLDNLEHLLSQEALDLIGSMLTTAPGVTLLITSRARLNVQGEAILVVGGLPIAPTARLEASAWLGSSTGGTRVPLRGADQGAEVRHRRDHDGCAHRYRGGVCCDGRA